MDPLSAFSLAGTILEFARFGTRLLIDGRELYKSAKGTLSANDQLELATADLHALLVKLKTRQHRADIAETPSKHDEEKEDKFQLILDEAEKTATELAERLDGLKLNEPKNRKWDSVRKAIQNTWTRDEIDSLTKKLARFKEAVSTHILFSITNRETLDEDSLRKSSRFDRLDERTQLIISSLFDSSIESRKAGALVQAVHDQLETLIQLVRRIDNVKSVERHETRTAIANRRALPGEWNEITAQFEMLDVSDDQETRIRHEVRREIVNTLAYSSMTVRYENIIEAFPKTFEWAFEDSTSEQVKWDNFSEWLKEGSGVYWISGKAGSGKSTLMKHIFDDNRTREYLGLWARDGASVHRGIQSCQLCLATFYFWNSGTPEQKSQTGLLRALLFQVLSFYPELVSVVFPDLWAKRYKESIEGRQYSYEQSLTSRRLNSAFRKLVQQSRVPLKVCFLVDGLDEFNGDHEELASLFKLASRSSMIKICLSSRPWVIFEQIYGSRPSMRLQDLTYHDIEHYVTSKFGRNPAFRRLQSSEPDLAVLLQTEVIEKAEGVFLWVQIVVDSLLFGIRNQDDIMILRQRLVAMPPKLEDLYLHLMQLIEPVYQSWASKAFRIARTVREFCSDDLAGPIHRTEGTTILTISTFFLAITENLQLHVDPSNGICVNEKVSSTTIRTLTEDSLPAKCDAIKTHLTARCAGLLEVPRYAQKGPGAVIQFLHRTARDFLYNEDNWSLILKYTKDTAFDPYRAMLMASVFELAIKTPHRLIAKSEIYSKVTDAMLYAYHIALSGKEEKADSSVLDNLDAIMTRWGREKKSRRKSRASHWAHRLVGDSQPLTYDETFIGLATLYGQTDFLNSKLALLDRAAAAQTTSKLLQILLPREDWPGKVRPPSERPEMVSTLFRHGANPNYRRSSYHSGPWSNVLHNFVKHEFDRERLGAAYFQMMKLFIKAGGDFEDVYVEGILRQCGILGFKEEMEDIICEMNRQKRLKEDHELQMDTSDSPRKKPRLDNEAPLDSSPRNIGSQSSHSENSDDTLVHKIRGSQLLSDGENGLD